MTCYSPISAWRGKRTEATPSGIFFNRKDGWSDWPFALSLPCGQCIGCRLKKSRDWAIRCVHESTLHKSNLFVTLTYDLDHLSADQSLDYRDFQLFMKRLRKSFHDGIRFYMCGEYGDQFGRPHFHACLFNLDFPDKKLWKIQRGNRLYVSKKLSDLWGKGYCIIGNVTFQSAAYISRYIMKKRTGDSAKDYYTFTNPETGEVFQRKPEFTNMSRRPGLGVGWFEKYHKDVFPSDTVVLNNKKFTPPSFYLSQYEVMYPDEVEKIKQARRLSSYSPNKEDSPSRRLRDREICAKAALEKFKRNAPV